MVNGNVSNLEKKESNLANNKLWLQMKKRKLKLLVLTQKENLTSVDFIDLKQIFVKY